MPAPTVPVPPIFVTRAAAYRVPSNLLGGAHAHPGEWQIQFVVAAEGKAVIGDHRYPVRAHDLYLIKPGQRHYSQDPPDPCPHVWAIGLLVNETVQFPFALSDLPDVIRDMRDPGLLETMRRLIDEYSARQRQWEWVCAVLAQELLLRASRFAAFDAQVAPLRSGGVHAEAITRARRYVHFHFQEPLTVGSLAREAGLSPQRFSAVFRRVCGKAPMNYVIDVRLDRASELLREGRLTVSQVAEYTGFSSVHYFSRVFRRRRGMTPTDYARREQGRRTTLGDTVRYDPG